MKEFRINSIGGPVSLIHHHPVTVAPSRFPSLASPAPYRLSE